PYLARKNKSLHFPFLYRCRQNQSMFFEPYLLLLWCSYFNDTVATLSPAWTLRLVPLTDVISLTVSCPFVKTRAVVVFFPFSLMKSRSKVPIVSPAFTFCPSAT